MLTPAVPAVPLSPSGRPAAAALRDPATWAAQTFSAVAVGDRRRTRRLVRSMTAIAAHPAASLPHQLQAPAAVKATYRLLHEPAVTVPAILAPALTATRLAATAHPVVLFVQDLTELDYSAHRQTVDLGPLGDGRKHGLLLQSALAVLPTDGAVLGLAALDVFPRVPAPRPGERTEERQGRPRESEAWGRLVVQIGPPPTGQTWVHVGDRGSDAFTFLTACGAQQTQVLIRVAQDRRLTTEAGAVRHLREYARTLPAAATQDLAVPSRIKTSRHPARTARDTTMALSWAPVTVAPPFHSPQLPPLSAWVVRTWEVEPPAADPDPLEWILLTTVSTTTAAEAWERVAWYTRRWLMEDFHQRLKTGCRVEQSQLRDRAALQRLVAMLAPVAVRLLQLRAAARASPEQPAATVVEERLVQVVAHLTGQAPDLSCAQFWRHVAQLGGHQGRTRDGPPGWRTLWRGWQYVQTVLTGIDLATTGTLP